MMSDMASLKGGGSGRSVDESATKGGVQVGLDPEVEVSHVG